MARWEPNARERLERAALDLFTENGYEATTVAEIVDRAALTKSTFFRHFADKREVLFSGQDLLTDLLSDAIRSAPLTLGAMECIQAALNAAGSDAFTEERHQFATQRRAVIDANSELQERELLKLSRSSTAMAKELRGRGIDDVPARLAAELCVIALGIAFERWAIPHTRHTFSAHAGAALRELQTSAQTLIPREN